MARKPVAAASLLGAAFGAAQGAAVLVSYDWLDAHGWADRTAFTATLMLVWGVLGALAGMATGRFTPRSGALVFALVFVGPHGLWLERWLDEMGRSPYSGEGALVTGAWLTAIAVVALAHWYLAELRLRARPALLALAMLVAVALPGVVVHHQPEAVAATGVPAAVQHTQPRPVDVVLISIDTLRADHLGAWGYERSTSPFLDALSERSVRFAHAVTPKSHTAPAMASLMTGQYPHQHGLTRNERALSAPLHTWAERLGEVGYLTHGVATNGWLTPTFGFDQGFDSYEVGLLHEAEHLPTEAAWVNERGLAWLDDTDDVLNPRFLWLHYIDPHAPYVAPSMHEQAFLRPGHGDDVPAGFARGNVHPDHELKGYGVEDYIDAYDAEIHYLDTQLEQLFAELERRGMDDALIIVTADHGEGLGEHGWVVHHGETTYDEEVHVPLIVHHPELTPGVVEQPVSLADVLPTTLEFLGLSTAGTTGTSRLGLLLGEPGGKSFAYSQAKYRDGYFEQSITDGRHTWVRRPRAWTGPLDALLHWQWQVYTGHDVSAWTMRSYDTVLFDHAADPLQRRDVQEAHPAAAASLDRQLRDHLRTAAGAPAESVELADATLENLRALGYIH